MTDGSEGGGTVHEGTQNGWPALVIDGENAAVSWGVTIIGTKSCAKCSGSQTE